MGINNPGEVFENPLGLVVAEHVEREPAVEMVADVQDVAAQQVAGDNKDVLLAQLKMSEKAQHPAGRSGNP